MREQGVSESSLDGHADELFIETQKPPVPNHGDTESRSIP
jgi:hypothetical protein